MKYFEKSYSLYLIFFMECGTYKKRNNYKRMLRNSKISQSVQKSVDAPERVLKFQMTLRKSAFPTYNKFKTMEFQIFLRESRVRIFSCMCT